MSSGCGDVLSLEDLRVAKLHQTFEAEVITGRAGGLASGSPIDYATNPVTLQTQKTMPAILRDIGFEPAGFDFSTGGTLASGDRNKAVLWPTSSGGDGSWYNWQGALPKTIPASSSPATTGGIGNNAWRVVADTTLRADFEELKADFEAFSANQRVFRVVRYADLATLVPTAAGDIAEVAYRIDANTKASRLGGGKFVAVPGSATADGATIMNTTGYYWLRVGYEAVTPQMFGTLQDGTYDDANAIRSAIALAQSKNMPCYLPAGDYQVLSGTLTISAYSTLICGDGIGKTNLYVKSDLTAFTVNSAINRAHIRDMTIQSIGITRTQDTRGVFANGGNLSTGSIGMLNVENMHIIGFWDAVNVAYCQLGEIHGCTFELNSTGYYSNLSINMRVYANKMNNNYRRGIYLNGDQSQVSYSAGTLISNNEIVNNGQLGTPQVTVQYNEHFTLSNNMIDVPSAGSTYNVHIVGTARGTISGNWIGSSISQGLRLENSQAVMVQGNNIVSCGTEGLANLGTSTGNIINGNVFENNTSTDILLGGTGTGSVINNNICASSAPTNSIAESSSTLSNLIVANIYKKGFVTGASTTIANNKLV